MMLRPLGCLSLPSSPDSLRFSYCSMWGSRPHTLVRSCDMPACISDSACAAQKSFPPHILAPLAASLPLGIFRPHFQLVTNPVHSTSSASLSDLPLLALLHPASLFPSVSPASSPHPQFCTQWLPPHVLQNNHPHSLALSLFPLHPELFNTSVPLMQD